MDEKEMLDRLIEISKKDGAMLAAVEALGRTIVELKDEIQSKEFDICVLKEELAILKGEKPCL